MRSRRRQGGVGRKWMIYRDQEEQPVIYQTRDLTGFKFINSLRRGLLADNVDVFIG